MEDEKLIELVQAYRFLYDKKSSNFKNVDKKQQAWEKISKDLSLPVDVCQKRWMSLRDRFAREWKKYLPSGSGSDVTKERWHLFDSMRFLEDHIKPRNTRGSTNIMASSIQNITPTEFEPDPEFVSSFSENNLFSNSSACKYRYFKPVSPVRNTEDHEAINTLPSPSCSEQQSLFSNLDSSTSSGKGKRKQSSIDQAFVEAVGCFKKLCASQANNIHTKQIDAIEGFGQMIMATIREMTPAKQTFAIKQMTDFVLNLKNEPDEIYEQT